MNIFSHKRLMLRINRKFSNKTLAECYHSFITSILLDDVAFKLPVSSLTMDSHSWPCFNITIINNKTAHGDRSAILGVEAKDSQFIVTGGTANITILDVKGTRIE